uniref:PAN domain protein n=1 Tax=Angiostrongylus cantonensis TaxID=6313 RepID=A0A0K0D0D1_ANGCA
LLKYIIIKSFASEQKSHCCFVVNNGCFEEISGYMMINVAAGLEHDVSMEECKCYCANSKISRRYSFECRSSTYYHEERDCVLNLDDRHRSPQLLEKQSGQHAITYLAPKPKIYNFFDEIFHSNLNVLRLFCPTFTGQGLTETQTESLLRSLVCFLELSDFVLEGTALAIETTVSVQKCKCKCIQGELIYGEACQSFQYYFDSNTCLINKQNRFSNPENLIYVPNSHPRSYFEHKCATKGRTVLNNLQATMSSTHVTSPSTLVYPTVGRCTYSAMYQTSFQGTKLIRTIYVKSPGDCFAACHAHSCRSANIISNGATNTCELFRDSIIDYRHLGMIIYDASTVYLDGIRCGDP